MENPLFCLAGYRAVQICTDGYHTYLRSLRRLKVRSPAVRAVLNRLLGHEGKSEFQCNFWIFVLFSAQPHKRFLFWGGYWGRDIFWSLSEIGMNWQDNIIVNHDCIINNKFNLQQGAPDWRLG